MAEANDPRRRLPAVGKLLAKLGDLPQGLAADEARALIEEVRGGTPHPEDWPAAVRGRVEARTRPVLVPVINATGVVLHTNLGRAPLAWSAARAALLTSHRYCNLEFDLATGERGERLAGVGPRVARVLGADAAIAVNNNAAAVLLVLTALAAGKEVIVSRGEAVEIGGSFRIPDVITACGARLREVGTTNRTRVADYARVIGPDSGVILRVHPSNFRVEGYTEAPDREALYALAQERGVPLVDDLGSGCLWPGLGERTVGDALGTSDLVTFSGDKLMGGPQAGLIVGRSDLVQRARKHPLYRALRLDKLVLATLEATWIEIEQERLPPAAGLLRVPVEQLRQRAEALAHSLRDQGVPASGEEDRVPVGGGSAPGEMVPTAVVRVPAANANELAARLRANDPPVVARIRDDALILDLRAVYDGDDALLDEAMARAWHDRPPPAQEEG